MTPAAAPPRVLLLAHDLHSPGTEELAHTVSEVLAPAEREHVLRKRLAADRTRTLIGRWLARRAAARIVGAPWTTLCTGQRLGGQPYVVGRPQLSLSIAHSGRYALAAVALGARVGVDTEQVARVTRLPDDAFLGPGERAALHAVPQDEERRAALWVLKEAAAKLTGQGLRAGLRSIGFECPGTRFPLVARTPYAAAQFRAFRLPGGYVAAVGVSAGEPPRGPVFVTPTGPVPADRGTARPPSVK
ncbi:putative 4'-phosphopantetheinyl transferase [Streptomyces afghaniensis 772]|uniref:Putative 4'-phosphopantetheinyl transferase n=1 Tax=Streptomyces afghaniensis 772 TaxID=1283301 RepID=S4MSY7_9ACTN|nr:MULTISPECIES: 4'-phosphopantetheinyl transferase superfamily protein [Streptomyces]EPJ36727.1 putative 4'-phosphopantetheinyl transferase [Streptomyces afghaniensis 772]UOB10339.1 4'-phosphopantetheinyl transferase superfamily protein [Streptomyces sp. HP-A2021]